MANTTNNTNTTSTFTGAEAMGFFERFEDYTLENSEMIHAKINETIDKAKTAIDKSVAVINAFTRILSKCLAHFISLENSIQLKHR